MNRLAGCTPKPSRSTPVKPPPGDLFVESLIRHISRCAVAINIKAVACPAVIIVVNVVVRTLSQLSMTSSPKDVICHCPRRCIPLHQRHCHCHHRRCPSRRRPTLSPIVPPARLLYCLTNDGSMTMMIVDGPTTNDTQQINDSPVQ